MDAVFAAMPKDASQSEPAKPGPGILASASTNPIMKPEATTVGKIGIKTSPIDFKSLFQNGCHVTVATLTSSLVVVVVSVTLRSSS